jgi:signal transduction histidine kinase
MRRRRRLLVAFALIGCLAIFALAHLLANRSTVAGHWTATERGELLLHSSAVPALAGLQGRTLVALGLADGSTLALDAALLHRAPRWQPQDSARAKSLAQNAALDQALARNTVQLHFGNGDIVTVTPQLRGYAGLGWWFWPLVGAALALYLFGWAVLLARPQARNALFLVMALCQAGNLLLIAVQTLPGLGLGMGIGIGSQMPLLTADMGVRLTLDAITGAAIAHAFALHPKRLANANAIAAAVWAVALGSALLISRSGLAHSWWLAQGLCVLLGIATLLVVARSYRLEPNPYALALRRFTLAALATLLLLSAAVAASNNLPARAHGVAVGASVAWYLFLASLLLLAPFLAGSRQVLREFAMLAGISTVAASLDLLFVALFALGPFTSLAIAVFVSLALYTTARQFLLNQVLGTRVLTTERTFEQLYRAARAVQAQPSRYTQVITQTMRELFEPLQCNDLPATARLPSQAQVTSAGSSLVVPVWVPNRSPQDEDRAALGLMLRFAQRGQRLFTDEDARLADRVVEQLRRAVAYDHAVEQGRSEERLRLAQDLHDDIGARLLTLMYQAPNPEMEDYIRHTLQDLKTLTRGLAASEHRLSHAAAEWKADLTQRLTAARAELVWSLASDHDAQLSVVQWSALTRILRELVTNALYHGHATRVEVSFSLQADALSLDVLDDGLGQEPQTWAHGLGMGGVRKRVKLLGGEVSWANHPPRGIVCRVRVPEFVTSTA